jgi:hypothetical protein
MGEVEVKEGDTLAVKNAVNNEIDIVDWITTMSLEGLEKLKEHGTKYEKYGHSDYVIKTLAKHYPPIADMEVIQVNSTNTPTKCHHTGVCDFSYRGV